MGKRLELWISRLLHVKTSAIKVNIQIVTWEGMRFYTHPAESLSPFLKKRWNDSEGMSHVPWHRGGLLTRDADISFSLPSMRGVSWLGFGFVVISKNVVRDR